MANFLDDLSVYNAKAAIVISQAVADGNTDKANMMSSLKTTANDTTLAEVVRLNALTALINLGGLLDIPLPPYFPLTVTYANTQTYVGIHDDLTGLQGGAPGDYQHLTTAEKISILGKASLSDITFTNLSGDYTDNANLAAAIDGKQTELNGTGFVKINGNQSTIYYDNTTYLSTISGIVAGGELTGTYPNPALSNAAVISKVLTGWNGSATYTAITSSDTILSGMEKLNARISAIIASPGGVSSIAGGTNAPSVLNVAASSSTGNVTFSVDFDTQNQNLFLASPNGSSGAPSFRAIAVNDLPNSGATAGTYGNAAQIPQIAVDAKGRITSISNITANAGGLVTAVSLTGPGIFNAYGSTGGSTPQLSFGLENQAANTVWAGPATGANAAPQFRALVEDDIPNLSTGKIDGLDNLLANKLDNALNDGEIWIGNSTNAPQMRSLSQDIEITLTGVATIQPNVVDFSKIQEITGADTSVSPEIPGNLLGRWAAGQGLVQEVVLSGDFLLDSATGVLSLSSPVAPVLTTKGGLITYSQSVGNQVQLSAVYEGRLLMTDSNEDKGIKWVEAQGDVEVDTTALDGTLNITAGAVTLDKMAALPAYTVIGNDTSGSLPPKALTKTELTTLVEQFTSTTSGAVPLSGAYGATYYLNAAGGWTEPGGGSPAGTGNEVQYRQNSTTFGAIPYMSFDSPLGEIRTVGSNFLLVDDVTTVAKSVYFDISNITSTGLSWAFPDTTDTFVGETFVQTIQNKTLGTGAAINLGSSVVGTMWYSSDTAGSLAELDPTGLGGKYLMLNATTLIPEWTGVTATTANNIAGGAANKILYQTAADTTGFIDAPTTADTFLKWTGSAFSWQSVSGSGTVNSGGLKELAYYNAAGTAVSGLAVSATDGTFFLSQVITAGVPANPVWTGVTGTGLVVLDDSPTIKQARIGNGAGNAHLHFYRGNTPGGLANHATLGFLSASKTMSIEFNADNFQSQFLFSAASSTKTYTFPDATGNVVIDTTVPSFTNGSSAGEIRLLEAAASGTDYIALKAPTSSASYSITFPNAAPSVNQVLVSDGSGILSWQSGPVRNANQFLRNYGAVVTANGSEQLIQSVLIPANTYTDMTGYMIKAMITRSVPTSNSVTVRFYINTSSAIGGPNLTTNVITVGQSANGFLQFERMGFIQIATGGSKATIYATAAANALSNNLAQTAALTTSAIDWAVDQYVILTVSALNGSTITCNSLTIMPQ